MKNTKPLIVSVETLSFKTWFAGTVKIFKDYMETNFPNNPKEEILYHEGGRYIKVTRGSSVHAFIDRTNGDVLKPATWTAPAKGARGNIFDTANGLANMSAYGPSYKRDMISVPVVSTADSIKTVTVNGVPSVIPAGSHVVKNCVSGREVVQAIDTPLCCDVSHETYHCM